MLSRLEDALRRTGVLDAVPEGRLAAGLDDPGLAARAGAPFAVMPLLRGRRPPPWAAAVLGAAQVLVVLDPAELAPLGVRPELPVVVAGLPAPGETAPGTGLSAGPAPERLVRLWHQEGAAVPTGGPGIAWVGGGPAAALPAAVEAWAEGRAVVALPGTTPHRLLRDGGALSARTTLEAVEATRYLCENRPLARALARRGRRVASALDDLELVAGRLAEAIVMAGEPG